MKTKFRNRALILLGLLIVLIAFAFWYKVSYSMELAQNQGINSPNSITKILIATQGSEFKNAVVANIIDNYKNDSIHLKTIDVSQLPQIDTNIYNAIVVLHTWEYGHPPQSVIEFVTKNKEFEYKMIVYSTSGAGDNKIEGIDALSGESILENVTVTSDNIIARIENLLK